MEKRKLQSMVDYVLERQFPQTTEQAQSESVLIDDFFKNVTNYAKFLSMPLTLGMFVPTDENGYFLEEPEKFKNWKNFDYSGTDIGFEDEKLCRAYQKALDNVIFEGFEYKIDKTHYEDGYYVIDSNENIFCNLEKEDYKIEDVSHLDLTLTQSAITKYQI